MSDRITHDEAEQAALDLAMGRPRQVVIADYFNQQRIRDAALLAAGLLDPATGEVRRVLGTLPVTADGCLIGSGEHITLHHLPAGETHQTLMMTIDSYGTSDEAYGPMLFSTAEARAAALTAEAAAPAPGAEGGGR